MRLSGLLDEFLVREARKRLLVFRCLERYLVEIKRVVVALDAGARVFLFGSVASGDYTFSSDVDVLILTSLKPSYVIAVLRGCGFGEPFEFHIMNSEEFSLYGSMIKGLKEV